MRKIVEFTLVAADGSMDVEGGGFRDYQDDAYTLDGLARLHACDALLMGRTMYEYFASVYTARKRDHAWGPRVNAMRKYVFSSTLERAEWNNTTILRGDVATEAARLKEESGGDLLIWGHTKVAETLMRAGLVDALELAIHPVFVGSGGPRLFREGQAAKLRLVSTKAFSHIVKLSYERV